MLCDKAAVTRLARTMGQVRVLPDGTFPLGVALLALRSDPMITLHLAPLHRAPQGASGSARDAPYAATKQNRQSQQDGKSKGKGKKGKTPPLPLSLKGKWHRMANGDPICFAYNIGGCDLAADGKRCQKGWHVCAEPRCLMDHPLPKHPKDGQSKRSS